MLNKIAIIGSGSWATALVKIFSESGVTVNWLIRTEEQAKYIRLNGKNPRYLTNAELNLEYIVPVSAEEDVLKDAQLVLFAVPSAYLAPAVANIDKDLLLNKQLAVSIKGFIPGTGYIPSIFLRHHLNRPENVMVLSGPCHAEEIALRRNTYLTIAGEEPDWVQTVSCSLNVGYVKTITNTDPVGIEFVAILKNIIAIATGIAHGLNYGDNFQAVLVSNAMREIDVFLKEIYPGKRDLFDSAYFGDMLVTAYSDYSRNRTLGKLIGRGIQVHHCLQLMGMVAEGFNASKELEPLLKKLSLSLPVINSAHRILHQHANPFHEFKLLEQNLR
ncbi:MAG TPA: NAD(P)H-dependent glycerol-3-phosphate dehydrogenase [Chitinophagaceae bacterium]|nr:NAD(P)H-dependent glycerol-3-phosphate dehydrogenase [Chitinophagaceae bacterium]